jgi:hypothetical protein
MTSMTLFAPFQGLPAAPSVSQAVLLAQLIILRRLEAAKTRGVN